MEKMKCHLLANLCGTIVTFPRVLKEVERLQQRPINYITLECLWFQFHVIFPHGDIMISTRQLQVVTTWKFHVATTTVSRGCQVATTWICYLGTCNRHDHPYNPSLSIPTGMRWIKLNSSVLKAISRFCS